jgi:catechol 2,3-dioxygenase-like lactoylglutathione lyase family enzyme
MSETSTATETPIAIASLAMVNLDSADPGALADFYSAVLGWPVVHRSAEYAMLSAEGSVPIGFGRVEGYQAPAWPDPASPKRFHLDFYVDDVDSAEKRCHALGATTPEFQPGGDRWRIVLDPAGHPLCLCPRPS